MNKIWLSVLILYIAISNAGCAHRKIVLPPESIESVRIFGGDGNYFRKRIITNRDTIRRISALLQSAEPVSLDTVNVHNTGELCFVHFKISDGGEEKFIYGITGTDGKILWYKANHYRLDSLDQYLR